MPMLKNIKRVNIKIRRLGKNIKCQDLLSYYNVKFSGNIYLKYVCVCVSVCSQCIYDYVCTYVCMYYVRMYVVQI